MKVHVACVSFAAVLAASAAPAATPASADVSAGPKHVHRDFDIMREGSKIGTDSFDVVRTGDRTDVKITSHILVKIAFITAYRYEHTETESWKGNQLTAFHSSTDDNGKKHDVSATANGGKLSLEVDGVPTLAPKGIMPASVWTAEIGKRTQVFDPANGTRMSIKSQDLGEEGVVLNGVPHQLNHVKLSGQFSRDLWFDDQGLVKMTLRGTDNSLITSQLRQTTASR